MIVLLVYFISIIYFFSSRFESGNVDIKTFFSALNWRESPIPHPKAGDEKVDENKIFELTTLERQELRVNYPALLKDLSGN